VEQEKPGERTEYDRQKDKVEIRRKGQGESVGALWQLPLQDMFFLGNVTRRSGHHTHRG